MEIDEADSLVDRISRLLYGLKAMRCAMEGAVGPAIPKHEAAQTACCVVMNLAGLLAASLGTAALPVRRIRSACS